MLANPVTYEVKLVLGHSEGDVRAQILAGMDAIHHEGYSCCSTHLSQALCCAEAGSADAAAADQ